MITETVSIVAKDSEGRGVRISIENELLRIEISNGDEIMGTNLRISSIFEFLELNSKSFQEELKAWHDQA